MSHVWDFVFTIHVLSPFTTYRAANGRAFRSIRGHCTHRSCSRWLLLLLLLLTSKGGMFQEACMGLASRVRSGNCQLVPCMQVVCRRRPHASPVWSLSINQSINLFQLKFDSASIHSILSVKGIYRVVQCQCTPPRDWHMVFLQEDLGGFEA